MAIFALKAQLPSKEIKLPEPHWDGKVSIEQALRSRRSVREFSNAPLELSQIGQLAWAAQGITSVEGHRTAPSAGGLYALELYVVAARVNGLPAGIYRYETTTHEVISCTQADIRQQLSRAALEQTSISRSAAVFAL